MWRDVSGGKGRDRCTVGQSDWCERMMMREAFWRVFGVLGQRK